MHRMTLDLADLLTSWVARGTPAPRRGQGGDLRRPDGNPGEGDWGRIRRHDAPGRHHAD